VLFFFLEPFCRFDMDCHAPTCDAVMSDDSDFEAIFEKIPLAYKAQAELMGVKQKLMRQRSLTADQSQSIEDVTGEWVESGRKASSVLCNWFGVWDVHQDCGQDCSCRQRFDDTVTSLRGISRSLSSVSSSRCEEFVSQDEIGCMDSHGCDDDAASSEAEDDQPPSRRRRPRMARLPRCSFSSDDLCGRLLMADSD